MKTLRFFGTALFAVLMSVGFTACSSSDDDDNGVTTSDKRLVRMTEQGESKTYTYEFTYDSQGRVVRKEVKRDGTLNYYYVYAYFDDLIVQKYYYNGYSEEYSHTLENGLIVSEEDKGWPIQYTYENGRLATMKNYNGVYSYIWENGNVTRIDLNGEYAKKYEYTNYIAPKGFFTYGEEEDLGLFYGKSAKNLPSKFVDGEDEIGKGEIITYDWTMKDGLPVKLIEMENDGGGASTYIITFEWE